MSKSLLVRPPCGAIPVASRATYLPLPGWKKQEEPGTPGLERPGSQKRRTHEAEAQEEQRWSHVRMQRKGQHHGEAVIQ